MNMFEIRAAPQVAKEFVCKAASAKQAGEGFSGRGILPVLKRGSHNCAHQPKEFSTACSFLVKISLLVTWSPIEPQNGLPCARRTRTLAAGSVCEDHVSLILNHLLAK